MNSLRIRIETEIRLHHVEEIMNKDCHCVYFISKFILFVSKNILNVFALTSARLLSLLIMWTLSRNLIIFEGDSLST